MTSGGLFDLEEKEIQIREYEERMTDPGFWDNQEEAQQVIDSNNNLKKRMWRRMTSPHSNSICS